MAYFLYLPKPPFFFYIFLINTIPIISESAINDAEALLRIKESLKNPQFLESWKLGTRPCDEIIKWVGLVCGNGIVTTLRLRSMNLSGDIDIVALSQLQGLRVLNLVNNSLSGPIPEFNKLGALKAIYLSMNNFSGEIPAGYFSKMVSLKKIWLDQNNFSGHIPSSVAQLPRLLELHINNNSFSGTIPAIGQQNLESIDFSNNNLSGDIPTSLSRFDVAAFEGNPGLCGTKFGRLCVTVVPAPKPPEKVEPPEKSLRIAYILMGICAFIFVSMIIAIYLLVRKREKEEAAGRLDVAGGTVGLSAPPLGRRKKDGSSSDSDSGGKSEMGSKRVGDLMLLNKGKCVFGLSELMNAGAQVIGNGSVGSSYKAKMSNGLIVVVKRLKEVKTMDKDGFKGEMKRLSRLSHRNVLPPVACHYQKDEKLVIHEYIPKGSLLYLLHGDRGESHAELNWPNRLKIVHGIALGMGCIHKELAMLALPHGNLKSSNVLVGPDNEPLVVDYGFTSVMDASHATSVLTAYKAPEAVDSHSISPKCDVYSLGIMILEILTGKFPSQYHNNQKGGTDAVQWVRTAILEHREVELLDPEMSEYMTDSGSLEEMQKLLRVGAACTESDPDKRLDIREVIRRIEEIKIEGSVDDNRTRETVA